MSTQAAIEQTTDTLGMDTRGTSTQAAGTQGAGTQSYIDALFCDYQETPALVDFKEELRSHLDERIKTLIQKGMNEKDAAEKALAELGDMSAVADEISRKKKQEVLSEMYMSTRNYISTKRMALYVLCGLVLGVGLMIALITWFGSGFRSALVSSFMAFATPALLGFLFLGLTQETASREAIGWKRALWYVLAAALILFGVLTAFITGFGTEEAGFGAASESFPNVSLTAVASVVMVFALPGIALIVFLVLTEKNRTKPWVIKQREDYQNSLGEWFNDPVKAERFGLICGALWIAAIAAFIALTMLIGFQFSWLAIAAALVAQMIIMASLIKTK